MSLDIDRVLVRLQFIQNNLNQLKRFAAISLDEYLDNYDQQLIVERLLERIG